MLRKISLIIFIFSLFVVTGFSQISGNQTEKLSYNPALTRQSLLKQQPVTPDLTRDAWKLPAKNRLSKGEKIAIWSGVAVGAVVLTAFIIWKAAKPKFNDYGFAHIVTQ